NTPTLRLEQDGSSGSTPQTWDIAGNETNFFIRDVTNGSKLGFRIQPGTPESTLTLRADGRVGIGTWSPSYALHMLTDSSTNAQMVLEKTSGASAVVTGGSSGVNIGSQSDHTVRFVVNGDTKMNLSTSGYLNIGSGTTAATHLIELSGGAYSDGATWTNASSRALKEDIETLTGKEAMTVFEKLNPVKYKYKKNDKEKYVGFIAEDVPELVATSDRKGIDAMDMVALLTKVVQEQQKTIDEFKAKFEKLENKNK
ncbi:MAG: tail fiber domain-containing protein, partial [bacterium]|nr:tail fiber domain-containing protein [bacterium]